MFAGPLFRIDRIGNFQNRSFTAVQGAGIVSYRARHVNKLTSVSTRSGGRLVFGLEYRGHFGASTKPSHPEPGLPVEPEEGLLASNCRTTVPALPKSICPA